MHLYHDKYIKWKQSNVYILPSELARIDIEIDFQTLFDVLRYAQTCA